MLLGEYAFPGVGRLATGTVKEVTEEAVELAARRVDVDSEMVGQDGPTYSSVNNGEGSTGPDFYVGPDGPESTLPSTGYRYDRYLNDDGTVNEWGQKTLDNLEGRATYIGFEKYETGAEARDAFQIKGLEHVNPLDPEDRSWSDARIVSEFDTLQLYEGGVPQARVPGRLGDSSEIPEPITEAYPEFGRGGAVQLHLDGKTLEYNKSEVLDEGAKSLIKPLETNFKFSNNSKLTLNNSVIRDNGDLSTERSYLGSSEGHNFAASVTEGGTGTAFAGHGEYVLGSWDTVVPKGTYVALPQDNIKILDETARYIETGDWDGLYNASKSNKRIENDISGMTTWFPGSKVPNYILSAPTNPPLNIYQNSTTVETKVYLDQLLKPNMGCVQWAACTKEKH